MVLGVETRSKADKKKQIEILQFLKDKGIENDVENLDDKTPLQVAEERKNHQALTLLDDKDFPIISSSSKEIESQKHAQLGKNEEILHKLIEKNDAKLLDVCIGNISIIEKHKKRLMSKLNERFIGIIVCRLKQEFSKKLQVFKTKVTESSLDGRELQLTKLFNESPNEFIEENFPQKLLNEYQNSNGRKKILETLYQYGDATSCLADVKKRMDKELGLLFKQLQDIIAKDCSDKSDFLTKVLEQINESFTFADLDTQLKDLIKEEKVLFEEILRCDRDIRSRMDKKLTSLRDIIEKQKRPSFFSGNALIGRLSANILVFEEKQNLSPATGQTDEVMIGKCNIDIDMGNFFDVLMRESAEPGLSYSEPELSYSEPGLSYSKEPFFSIAGLIYQKLPGDGNCLYRAVCIYKNDLDYKIGGKEYTRQLVASYIEQHKKELAPFINLKQNQTIEGYIQGIRDNEEWADAVEIEVLMRLLDQPIVVINPGGAIINKKDLDRFNGEPIFVYYNGHNHYDVFTIQSGRDSRTILKNLIAEQNCRELLSQEIIAFLASEKSQSLIEEYEVLLRLKNAFNVRAGEEKFKNLNAAIVRCKDKIEIIRKEYNLASDGSVVLVTDERQQKIPPEKMLKLRRLQTRLTELQSKLEECGAELKENFYIPCAKIEVCQAYIKMLKEKNLCGYNSLQIYFKHEGIPFRIWKKNRSILLFERYSYAISQNKTGKDILFDGQQFKTLQKCYDLNEFERLLQRFSDKKYNELFTDIIEKRKIASFVKLTDSGLPIDTKKYLSKLIESCMKAKDRHKLVCYLMQSYFPSHIGETDFSFSMSQEEALFERTIDKLKDYTNKYIAKLESIKHRRWKKRLIANRLANLFAITLLIKRTKDLHYLDVALWEEKIEKICQKIEPIFTLFRLEIAEKKFFEKTKKSQIVEILEEFWQELCTILDQNEFFRLNKKDFSDDYTKWAKAEAEEQTQRIGLLNAPIEKEYTTHLEKELAALKEENARRDEENAQNIKQLKEENTQNIKQLKGEYGSRIEALEILVKNLTKEEPNQPGSSGKAQFFKPPGDV